MNKIKFGFMSLLIALGLASCNDNDYKYTPADVLQNEQVAFPPSTPTTVSLTAAEPFIDLELTRQKTDGDLTVNIIADGELGNEDGTVTYITVPNSVTFKDGEEKTFVHVAADVKTIGYDNVKKISLSIAEDEFTTPYGFSKLEMAVSFPAPWKSLGLATYTEDIMTSFYNVQNLSYEVEIQENLLQPGLFRLVNPYGKAYPYNEPGDWDESKNYYLEINATDPDFVYIMPQGMGLNWGKGELFFADMAGFYIARGNDPAAVKAAGWGGTYKDGEITFPAKAMVTNWDSFADGAYYSNNNGKFSVLMPGAVKADYSLEMTYAGIMTAADNTVSAVVSATLGADATDVRAIVAPRAADADAIADALASDEFEYVSLADGSNMIAFDPDAMETSELQVVAAVVVDGAVKNVAKVNFEYYGGGKTPWQSIGIGLYRDDAVITMFKGFETAPQVYEVEFYESTERPGLYRVMNPYSPGVHPYGEALANSGFTMPDADNSTYITVDAQVSDGVMIPTSSLGVDLGDGFLDLVSAAAYYYESGQASFEELYALGYCGKVVNGNIVFPALTDSEGDKFQGFLKEAGQLAYYAGSNGAIQFLLPDAYAADESRQNATKYAMRAAKLKASALELRFKKESKKVSGKQLMSSKMIKKFVKNAVKFNGTSL